MLVSLQFAQQLQSGHGVHCKHSIMCVYLERHILSTASQKIIPVSYKVCMTMVFELFQQFLDAHRGVGCVQQNRAAFPCDDM